MGLRNDMASAADAIISGFGDLILTVEYHVTLPTTSYDVTNDTPINNDYFIECRAAKYKVEVKTNEYFKTDAVNTRFAITGNDMRAFGPLVPKEADYIVSEGIKYEIVDIKDLGLGACYIFTTRAL